MITINTPQLIRKKYQIKDTKGIILSDKQQAIDIALQTLKTQRQNLETYCQNNPHYQHSYTPIQVTNGPTIAKRMVQSAQKANVGPMAAVAGVLADMAAEKMIKTGATVAIVENGGEAALHSYRPINLALQAGETELSRRIGFKLEKFPIGVATSSGRYSHAVSLGDSDAVTLFAVDAGLADAAATAVGTW